MSLNTSNREMVQKLEAFHCMQRDELSYHSNQEHFHSVNSYSILRKHLLHKSNVVSCHCNGCRLLLFSLNFSVFILSKPTNAKV